MILDIFSRFVVGWLIAPRESAELAQQLIADTVARHDVLPGQLTCPVPCDHIPVRSWPLFKARQLMRDVIESMQGEKKS